MRIHKPHETQLSEKGAVLETKKLRLHPATVHAEIEGNAVRLKTSYAASVTLFLGRTMIDWEKPVVVSANGKVVSSRKLTPALEFMLEEARISGRRDRVYAAALQIALR